MSPKSHVEACSLTPYDRMKLVEANLNRRLSEAGEAGRNEASEEKV